MLEENARSRLDIARFCRSAVLHFRVYPYSSTDTVPLAFHSLGNSETKRAPLVFEKFLSWNV